MRRHLLVAAALREVLRREPIVVGGTAEEFWTQDAYHETDLDLCVPLGPADRKAMAALGFRREGRHWVIGRVAVEVPDSRIDGDVERTHLEPVGEGAARIIGVDDLYLDRLRQATSREHQEGIEFHSALAVAAARFTDIDWRYVATDIRGRTTTELAIGDAMRRVDAKIRRRVRRELGG
ncbi:MAG: hypothetical protein ACREQY_10015 [Candidatus Binatia bacterium]